MDFAAKALLLIDAGSPAEVGFLGGERGASPKHPPPEGRGALSKELWGDEVVAPPRV